MRIGDCKIHENLVILTIDGFDGPARYAGDVDPPGSANFLCEQYGMSEGPTDGTGIIWTDYEDDGPRFRILVDSTEAGDVKDMAESIGYTVGSPLWVDSPRNFGDGSGTVEILRHRDGWIVVYP